MPVLNVLKCLALCVKHHLPDWAEYGILFRTKYLIAYISELVQKLLPHYKTFKKYRTTNKRPPSPYLDNEALLRIYDHHLRVVLLWQYLNFGSPKATWRILIKAYLLFLEKPLNWLINVDFTQTNVVVLPIPEALLITVCHLLKGVRLMLCMWAAVLFVHLYMLASLAGNYILLPMWNTVSIQYQLWTQRWVLFLRICAGFTYFSITNIPFFVCFFVVLSYYTSLQTDWQQVIASLTHKLEPGARHFISLNRALVDIKNFYNIDIGWFLCTLPMFFLFLEPGKHWWTKGQYYSPLREVFYGKLTYVWFTLSIFLGLTMAYVVSGSNVFYYNLIPTDPLDTLKFQHIYPPQLRYTIDSWWDPLRLKTLPSITFKFEPPMSEFFLERSFWRHDFSVRRNMANTRIYTPTDYQTVGSWVVDHIPSTLKQGIRAWLKPVINLINLDSWIQLFPRLYYRWTLPAADYFVHPRHKPWAGLHMFGELKSFYLRSRALGSLWYWNSLGAPKRRVSDPWLLHLKRIPVTFRPNLWSAFEWELEEGWWPATVFRKRKVMNDVWGLCLVYNHWIVDSPALSTRAMLPEDPSSPLLLDKYYYVLEQWDFTDDTFYYSRDCLLEHRSCRLDQYYLDGRAMKNERISFLWNWLRFRFYTLGGRWLEDNLSRSETVFSDMDYKRYHGRRALKDTAWHKSLFSCENSFFAANLSYPQCVWQDGKDMDLRQLVSREWEPKVPWVYWHAKRYYYWTYYERVSAVKMHAWSKRLTPIIKVITARQD